ncbi:MAG TPA: hypothetical protein VMB79_10170 [Jatrophihabitans sp.]|nr:hypothetical protein [Jatrophihabitans sp.]
MPEPLVCEDTSLTRLMETVHSTPGARILYQDTVRRGGVLGFFAREVHRVAYLVESGGATAERAEAAAVDGLLDDLEPPLQVSVGQAAEPAGDAAQPDFASVLSRYVMAEEQPVAEPDLPAMALVAELAASEPDGGGTAGDPAPAAEAVPTVEAVPECDAAATVEAVPAAVTPLLGRGREARNRLEMLMQLRQVGVPVSLNPSVPVQGTYEALEDILAQLPKPPELPAGAGQVLVIVGEGAPALHAARTISRMLRLKLSSIVAAGLGTGMGAGLRKVSGPDEAVLLRAELAVAPTPTVVVVATDGAGAGPDDPWPAELVTAFAPASVWAVVDARWKSDDSHAHLARLPRAEALVVHSAELSASPATVWELELPIALLDDRRPTDFVWLGMLIGLVGGAARHRATA